MSNLWKLPSADLNLAVDFEEDFVVLVYPRKGAPKIHIKTPVRNLPGNSFRKSPHRISAETSSCQRESLGEKKKSQLYMKFGLIISRDLWGAKPLFYVFFHWARNSCFSKRVIRVFLTRGLGNPWLGLHPGFPGFSPFPWFP